MKTKPLFPILLICLICCSFSLWGQTTTATDTDYGIWQAFGTDITVNPIFKVYLEKQLRYRDKFSNLRSDIMEAGVRVKLRKWIALRLNYRYTILPDRASGATRRRYRFDGNVNLRFKFKVIKKLKSLRFTTRTRLQREFIKDGGFVDTEWELRNRLKFLWPLIPKLSPYFSFEYFKGLGSGARIQDKYRLSLGVEWKITKQATIKPFYHFQRDLVAGISEVSHIFGTKFNYSF